MFERIKSSLFYPKEIGKFANDPFWRLLLHALLLSIFLSIPMLISCVQTSEISDITKSQIKESIIFNDVRLPDLKIIDGVLIGDGELTYEHELATIYINSYSASTWAPIVIELLDTKVVVTTLFSTTFEYTYLDLGITDFDFRTLQSNNVNENYSSYNQLFYAINQVLVDSKPIWGAFYVFASLLIMFIYYWSVVLLISLMYKFFTTISYKKLLRVALYCFTWGQVGFLLATLWGVEWLDFVFQILSFGIMSYVIRVLYFNRLKNDE